MQKDELKRQAKVIDMMLTMHSILASRYSKLSKLLELSMLAISTILVALTFIDPRVLNYFNIETEIARIIIGASAIIVFFLSIVSLIVDWKGKATQHREAFNTLIPLKTEWREVLAFFNEQNDRSRADFARKSALILGNLIAIPDSKFNALKARHYHKIMLSKLISNHPGSSVILLRLCIWGRCNWKVLKTTPEG
ncbi:MAG: hypothetical protein KJ822_14810 [Proteobacteria bacterium]|nr:hypothetical protein [Pseudomonadota bacterium]MBU4356590.1 hypothetical protein [Pseudomonadota bacterium]